MSPAWNQGGGSSNTKQSEYLGVTFGVEGSIYPPPQLLISGHSDGGMVDSLSGLR